MKYISNKMKFGILSAASALLILSSCNKDLEQFTEPTQPTGKSLGTTLSENVSDSLFYRIVLKSGMKPILDSSTLIHTLFVPDNNAVIASFGGSLAAANATIAALPAANCAGIVKYAMVPGKLLSSQITAQAPALNMQQPTDIVLDPTNPLIRMTSFPSKNVVSGAFYYNNVPIVAADEEVGNGVIHHIAFIAAPPTGTLKTLINATSDLSYFSAAVARADSGQVGLNRFDSLLNYPVTNMTVLVPNDAAFQTVIYGIVYAKVFALTGNAALADAQANLAVAAGPAIFQNPALYGDLPAESVRGILAYHIFAAINPADNAYEPIIRSFSVNYPPATAAFQSTLVNAAFAAHPGVMIMANYTGPFVTSFTFTGLGTFPPGGTPYSDPPANAIGQDKLAVNGVYHVIDKVLFPQ